MRRFYFILAILAFAFNLTASAQFYVWKNGKVDFHYADGTPDSVTFLAPAQAPDVPVVNPDQPDEPVVNPDQPDEPVVNPDQPDEPVVNPDQPDEPVVNPDQPDEPIVNPDQPDVPVVNPDQPSVEPETPVIVNGALQSLFSVATDKKVLFSQGNLQYQASTGTWQFAEKQYDVMTSANTAISNNNEGWIDLFGWGTSGWNGSGAKYYNPWDSSKNNGYDYGPYKNNTPYDLTEDFANADWGVYNAISNGGNEAGIWRTMTAEEWEYLFTGRANATSLYGVAQVAKVNGLVVLPDDWALPESATFAAGFSSKDGDYANKNTYSAEEWEVMEKAGAVFLPASGIRKGTEISYDYDGAYWSSTLANKSTGEYSYACCFYSMGVTPQNTDLTSKLKTKNCFGMAVRLVKTAK